MRLSSGAVRTLRVKPVVGIGTTCHQVLIRPHGYRPPTPRLTRPYAIYATDGDRLDALPHQDKRQNIRFLPLLGSPDYVLSRCGITSEEVDFTFHMVPFWTLLYQFDTHLHVEEESHGGLAISCSTEALNLSCSIAAVPPGHWCHGIMLPTSFSSLTSAVEHDPAFSESPEAGPQSVVESLAPHSYTLDSLSTEDFGIGIPELDVGVWTSLLKGQTRGTDVRCFRRPLRLPTVHATPIYRPVYKMVFKDGTIAYIDGYASSPLHWFAIEKVTGRSYMDPNRWDVKRSSGDNVRGLYLDHASPTLQRISPILPTRVCDSINDRLVEAAVKTRVKLKDPCIVKLGPVDWWTASTAGSCVQAVDFQAEQRLVAAATGSIKTISECSDVDMRNIPDSPISSAPLSPRPSIWDTAWVKRVRLAAIGSAPTTSRTSFAPKPAPVPAPNKAPPPLPPPSNRTRARAAPPRSPPSSPPSSSPQTSPTSAPPQGKDTTRPEPKFKPHPDPAVSSGSGSSKAKKAKKTPPAPPPKLAPPPSNDPQGHYRTLGIDFTSEFLDSGSSTKIDQLIADRKKKLARKHHPDLPGSDGDARRMAEINAASDAIERLKNRQEYQRQK